MRASILFLVATTGTAIADDAVDRQVTADVERANELWERSCPVAPIDGACVRLVSKPRVATGAIPTHCGPDHVPEITVVPRDAIKARAAMAAFHDAIARFEAHGEAARAAYARAELADIDVDYEAFLSITVPAHLDFRVKANVDKFSSWIAKKTAAARALTGKLRRIAELHDPAATIASTARLGQVFLGFTNALYSSEIPAELETDIDAVDAYCDRMVATADPLEQESFERFTSCLALSTQLAWFDDSSRICERELARIRPEEFPPMVELHVAPTATAPIEVEGPR
jgi:hypothetical protein